MTPKEKANELIKKFYEPACQMNFTESHGWELDAKQTLINATQCAIIAVEEIIKIDALIDEDVYVDTPSYKPFWNEVLTHLKNKS